MRSGALQQADPALTQICSSVTQRPTSDDMAIALGGVSKMFVGEVIEAGARGGRGPGGGPDRSDARSPGAAQLWT